MDLELLCGTIGFEEVLITNYIFVKRKGAVKQFGLGYSFSSGPLLCRWLGFERGPSLCAAVAFL